MAAVTKKSVTITTYDLQLTEEEAEALVTALFTIGGDPVRSMRAHTDRIMRSLSAHGVRPRTHQTRGNTYFQ